MQDPAAGRIERASDSVAYAAHADGLKGAMSVAENLRFWARIFGAAPATVDAALAALNLSDLGARPAALLSAGQKRRLGLARLVVLGRPLWVLDEPTVSLDAASVARFAVWLRERHLASGGVAVIATHVPLGLDAPELELSRFRADPTVIGQGSDAAFL